MGGSVWPQLAKSSGRAVGGRSFRRVATESQAYAKLIRGEIALAKQDTTAAIKAFTEANNQLNTWIDISAGKAYLERGSFTEADHEFDQCLKRRGEALAVLDEWPLTDTSTVYYYLGRVRQK